MDTFSVKFRISNLDLDAIVTASGHHQQFKVEMVTDESDAILLTRSDQGVWTVARRGQREISDQEFQELGKAIDRHLDNIHSAKTMLVLTDFSDAAFNASRYAAALTHQLKTSHFILYHSHEYLAVVTTTFAPTPQGSAESAKESLEKLIDLKKQLESLVDAQTTIDVRTDERSLATAVNALVEQHQAGLVVMGITGKSDFEKTLVGSNTITIAKACPIPLLIVPPEAAFKNIQRVVFACDLKKVSKTTPARAIKTFIHTLSAKLLILNVGQDKDHFDPDTVTELDALHQLWDDERPEYHYTDHEDIVKGIMAFADEHQSQLVITIPKEYGFFETLFHRSLTKKLAYHTHLPLLLFREDT